MVWFIVWKIKLYNFKIILNHFVSIYSVKFLLFQNIGNRRDNLSLLNESKWIRSVFWTGKKKSRTDPLVAEKRNRLPPIFLFIISLLLVLRNIDQIQILRRIVKMRKPLVAVWRHMCNESNFKGMSIVSAISCRSKFNS